MKLKKGGGCHGRESGCGRERSVCVYDERGVFLGVLYVG